MRFLVLSVVITLFASVAAENDGDLKNKVVESSVAEVKVAEDASLSRVRRDMGVPQQMPQMEAMPAAPMPGQMNMMAEDDLTRETRGAKKSKAKGRSTKKGKAKGRSLKKGKGKGRSLKKGKGKGRSLKKGKGKGRSLKKGKGKGRSLKKGKGKGRSLKKGKGKGRSAGRK